MLTKRQSVKRQVSGTGNKVRLGAAWLAALASFVFVAFSGCSSPKHVFTDVGGAGGGSGTDTSGSANAHSMAGKSPSSTGGGGTTNAGGTADVVASAGDAPVAGAGGSTMSPDPEGAANGDPCTEDERCANKHCVDGVCCDRPCTGQCEACNEPDSKGTCSTVTSGAPRGNRPACDGSGTCKGECGADSATRCSYPGSDKVCTASSCTGGKATTASLCNGAGSCTGSDTSPCASGQCANDGLKCSGACSAASCGATSYCDAGTGACIPLKKNGTACSVDQQCELKHCVDGVCCDSACSGQCQACSSAGTCSRVSSGAPKGNRTPCGGSGECGGYCNGSSDTQCFLPGATVTCSNPSLQSCSADLASAVGPVCDGKGTCSSTASTPCGSGKYCSSSACVSKLSNGTACTKAAQCASGACTSGICCSAGQINAGGICCAAGQVNADGICCPSGQSNCNGSCFNLNSSAAHCGDCQTACSPGQSCQGGVCCGSGFSNCSGMCVNLQTDSQHCGSSCPGTACGANQACKSGSCACAGSTLTCGTCGSWDFESGGTQNWELFNADPTATKYLDTSNGRLVYHYQDFNASSGAVSVWLCPDHTLPDLNGYAFSAKIELLNQMNSGLGNQVYAWVNNGKFVQIALIDDPAGFSWLNLTGTVQVPGASVLGISFTFNQVFNGSILIDDVQLSPP